MYVHHGQSAKWSLFFYFVFFVPKSRTFRKYGVNDGVHEKKISMNAFLGNTKHSSVNRKLGGGGFTSPPPSSCWFSLNNSQAFSKFLSQTFVPNLVSLPCPSLRILGKIQTGVFTISGLS